MLNLPIINQTNFLDLFIVKGRHEIQNGMK